MPARKTREFFAAMVRHTPLSTLVVSSHGPSIIPRLREQAYGFPSEAAAELIAQYEQTGYGYRDYGGSERETRASLTNENYGISLTNEIWLRETLSGCGLGTDAYHAQLWDDHHDIVVARLLQTDPSRRPVEAPGVEAPGAEPQGAKGILARLTRRWRS